MSQVVIVASFKAAEGRGDDLIAAFEPVIKATHAEEGCVRYALHRDNNDPDTFVHIEVFRSQDDLNAHFAQPYLAELTKRMGEPGLLAAPVKITFASPVELGDSGKGRLASDSGD